ncbi:hypothetical protein [Aestuariivivens sp. NBU2969]|uniref:hypothetical protein n=1 Tax=Aestuariivivens sp. NBU2969 TaxID=2873267 RepID=UPI001CBD3166|nr:hypothetical protein [Aestuariivivens sp. NBU2969]
MKIQVILFLVLCLYACSRGPEKASMVTSQTDPVSAFAHEELMHLTEKSGSFIFVDSSCINEANWLFHFEKDTSMAPYQFAYSSNEKKGKNHVVFKGANATTQLHALYSFLEKGGYRFEITGPKLKNGLILDSLKNQEETILPTVKKRGIRQHINFPMDVSAWTEHEAIEYIHNLARMKFNYMTFHSYPGQWYEVNRKDTTEYAGHFFYGKTHFIPDNDQIKLMATNEKYFCIPEIEQVYEDKAEKSKQAMQWLHKIMSETKRSGMQLQFSFEPRSTDVEVGKTVETVKAILKEYPMIDALEFITEEAGGWGAYTTRRQTEEMIRQHYGDRYWQDDIVMNPIREEQTDLAYIYGQVGHSAKVIDHLKNNNIINDALSAKIGVYCAIPDYAKAAYYLARQNAPDIEVAILSGHQSSRVKNNVPKIIRDTDWNQSVIYSWIEFDGMMFLQQNGVSGIMSTIDYASKQSSDGTVNAILYNHWRTAENYITARYASESAIKGAIKPSDFYDDFASFYEIKPREKFILAMEALDQVDIYGTDSLGNFGFCWEGRWRNGFPVTSYKLSRLKKLYDGYEVVRQHLKECADATISEVGKNQLSFLDNRLMATLLYIKAFQKAWELDKFDTANELSEKDKRAYVNICNEVLAIFDQFITIYSQQNVDRGCVGNLVSLWYGPIRGVKILRQKHGDVPLTESIPSDTPIDEPPLPIVNVTYN